MSDLIDNGGYRFWDDDFSIQSAYKECKAVFDGITDDDAFQESDTGIILYHAHEIMYALKKALPTAQPDPNCSEIPNNSDTISRQAAIDAVKRLSLGETDATRLSMRIGDYLERLPSAQTERPKGEWIDNETSYADGVRQTCTCSVCGIRSVRPLGDFCRWCGADMRGQQDE